MKSNLKQGTLLALAAALTLSLPMGALAQNGGAGHEGSEAAAAEDSAPAKKENLVLKILENKRADIDKQEAAIKEIESKIHSAELRSGVYSFTATSGAVSAVSGVFMAFARAATQRPVQKAPVLLMILGTATLVGSASQITMTEEERTRALKELKDAHDQLNTSKDYLNKVEADLWKR